MTNYKYKMSEHYEAKMIEMILSDGRVYLSN